MIVHVFNSSVVSGPEKLAIPALMALDEPVSLIFLNELRLNKCGDERRLEPMRYAEGLGHRVVEVPVRSRVDHAAIARLRDVLDSLQPSIVHAHDVKASVYVDRARSLRPGFNARLVSTHHGTGGRGRGKVRLYEEYYVRWVLPRFDRVLCVCELDSRSVIRRGLNPERVITHFNGVDRFFVSAVERAQVSERVRAGWRKLRPDLPASSQAWYLGAVARLSSEKRHDRMLNVLRLLESAPGSRRPILLCFGRGSLEAALKRKARQLGIEDRVFWMGYSDSVSDEMAGFDLLLSLSDGEGIPISFLEAAWAGTPIFSTKVGGVPDLIPSERFGSLVSPEKSERRIAQELRSLLEGQSFLREQGEALQARVAAHFSQTSWLEKLREVYASMRSSPAERSVFARNESTLAARRVSASE